MSQRVADGRASLSQVYARLVRRWRPPYAVLGERPFRVVSIANPKGGVGKTTLATNLAAWFRALRPDLDVLILGLDDQSLIDRMFAREDEPPRTWRNVATGLRTGDFTPALRAGLHGVHYVPSAPDIGELGRRLGDPQCLSKTLERTGWQGLVVVDTKGDLEILTTNALIASDLVLVPVRDYASLREARKVFERLRQWGLPRERARIVLSMLDLRVKYREGEARDIRALLLSELRRRGYPMVETFVSYSPVVESLCTNPQGRTLPVLHAAPGSLVQRQMHELAGEVLTALGREPAPVVTGALRRAGDVKRRLLQPA